MDERVRVLVVDHEDRSREEEARHLQGAADRFAVSTAGGVDGALDLLAPDIDCVVAVHDPPELDGLALLRAVREDDPDLPFVLYTDGGSEAVASEAISAGVSDYVRRSGEGVSLDRLAASVRDAVDEYRATQELRASRDRLSLLVEQSPIGVIEWDENFDVRHVNAAATDILGYSEAELRGDSWERIVPPEDMPAVDEVVEDLLANQGGFHSVNENVRADGERITCEWHNRVITDEGGETVAIVSQFQDVTERKRQERALAESEARYESMTEDVLENSEVGTIVVDADYEVVWANAAIEEFFGVDRELLVGADHTEAVRAVKDVFADDARFERRLLEAYEDNTETLAFEAHVLPGEGRRERWLSHWSKPIESGLYEGGRMGHYTDVTDQRKRSQQLDAMDRVMRHNLQNAMTVVLGSADTIADLGDGTVAEHAEMIRRSGRELLAMTDKQRLIVELLSDPPDLRRLDVSRLVTATAERVVAGHDGVALELDVPPDVTARAVPQLEDAVTELVENAVVHADDARPAVGVELESVDDRVRVQVSDTGPSIPDAELAVLRGEGEGGPLYHGSGMGLWLVNWVVTYSDGSVTVTENEPCGNVVTVELRRDRT